MINAELFALINMAISVIINYKVCGQLGVSFASKSCEKNKVCSPPRKLLKILEVPQTDEQTQAVGSMCSMSASVSWID